MQKLNIIVKIKKYALDFGKELLSFHNALFHKIK